MSIPSRPTKFPVTAESGAALDTVLSSVLTNAIVYFHPPLNVLMVPLGRDDARPSLIQIKLGLSMVRLFVPVFHVGCVVPVNPDLNGASKYPLVSVMIVSGSVYPLGPAHT